MEDRTEKMKDALAIVERIAYGNTCAHSETHRRGVIWTICDSCGAKWADDEGGFKPNEDVKRLDDAFTVLWDGIKTPLDTGKREPMSHNDVLSRLYEFQWNWEQIDGDRGEKVVQSLEHIASVFCAIHGPAPKMRKKAKEEKINDLAEKYDWLTCGPEVRLLQSVENVEAIDELCRGSGIPLETTE